LATLNQIDDSVLRIKEKRWDVMRFRVTMAVIVCSILISSCNFTPNAANQDGKPISPLQGNREPMVASDAQKQTIPTGLPKSVEHVVVVVEENHSYQDIMGSSDAPYIHSLAKQGAVFSNYHAIEHPSQPNYLDLFSGDNQGVTDDSCPHSFSTDNLANQLLQHGLTFQGFSEDLPYSGFTGCSAGGIWKGTYARKHNPWVNFTNVPKAVNLPFSMFPHDFRLLPTISFVIPNLKHDMHDGTIREGDQWLQEHLDAYVKWSQNHNSLLVVVWDEDDGAENNRIPMLMVGPMVRPGTYTTVYNHFHLLRTLEDLYGLQPIGKSREVSPIMEVWR
jgi:phosphatidylinositol-3-phosphatase